MLKYLSIFVNTLINITIYIINMADFTVIKCSKCYIYKPHFNTIGRFNLILLCLSRCRLILIKRQELANYTLLVLTLKRTYLSRCLLWQITMMGLCYLHVRIVKTLFLSFLFFVSGRVLKVPACGINLLLLQYLLLLYIRARA